MRAQTVVSVLFLVAACQTAPTPEMSGTEAEVQEAIGDRWGVFQDVYMSHDLDGFSSHWTEDLRVLGPGIDMNANEFRTLLAEFWGAGGENFSFDVDSYEIFVHGDVAYQIGRYDESFQWAGEEPGTAANHFFARWEKGPDGVWRIDRFLSGPVDAPEEG